MRAARFGAFSYAEALLACVEWGSTSEAGGADEAAAAASWAAVKGAAARGMAGLARWDPGALLGAATALVAGLGAEKGLKPQPR